MALVTHNEEEKQLYTAYGMTVYGTENEYDWAIYEKPKRSKVYTTLRIEKENENILDLYLGNRFAFEDNFTRTIDNFLFWIDRESPDTYDIENQVFKSLCIADGLFNHRIESVKKRENLEAKEKERVRNIEEDWNNKVKFLSDICDKNGWLLYTNEIFDAYMIFKAKSKSGEEFLKKKIAAGDYKEMGKVAEFCTNYPENPDGDLIKSGRMDEGIEYFKEVK